MSGQQQGQTATETPPQNQTPPVPPPAPPAAPPAPENSGSDTDVQIDGLGDAGKAAIDRMKGERNAARAELKAFTDLGLSVEEVKSLMASQQPSSTPASGSETPSVDEQVASALASERRALAVQLAAVGAGFTNPADAVALLDAGKLAGVPIADGTPDAAKVLELVTELATSRPYLLRNTIPSAEDAGLGNRGGGAAPNVAPGYDRIRAAYESTK